MAALIIQLWSTTLVTTHLNQPNQGKKGIATMTKEQEKRLWQDMIEKSKDPSAWYVEDDESATPQPNGTVDTLWVYREDQNNGSFVVGYYSPEGIWVNESKWFTAREAAHRVHWLNGGKPK